MGNDRMAENIKIRKVPNRKMGSRTISDNSVTDRWAGLFYFGLIVLLTWPLVIKLNSIIPGLGHDGGDSFHFLWDMWWVKKTFLDGQNVFNTDYLFYPNGVNLVYHTLILGQAILALPWLFIFPLILVFNFFYLLFMWLAAMFAFWLARLYWKNSYAAWLAGLIYAFSPFVMAHSLGHFNLTAIWVFPAVIYFLRKNEDATSQIWLVLAGLVMGFTLLNDYQYFVFLSLLVGGYYFYLILHNRKIWPYIYHLAGLGMMVILLGFPLIWNGLVVARYYLPQALISEVSFWSADLFSFFVPSYLHPLWGELGGNFKDTFWKTGVESVTYVGWTVLVMFVLGWFFRTKEENRQSLRFWQMTLIVFFILSLGPFLKILGETNFQVSDSSFSIALPYILFYKIPILSVARVPARFYVLISLSLAMLASYSISLLLRMVNRYSVSWNRWVSFIVVFFFGVLIMTEYISLPFSYQEVKVPSVYERIKSDDGDFTVLELPLWWTSGHRTVGDPRTIIQYYQTYHEKKILNGSVSRVPDALFDYYSDMPGVKYLTDINNDPDEDDLNRGLVLYAWKHELNIKYTILHKKYFTSVEVWQIDNYLQNNLGLTLVSQDEGENLYMVPEGTGGENY